MTNARQLFVHDLLSVRFSSLKHLPIGEMFPQYYIHSYIFNHKLVCKKVKVKKEMQGTDGLKIAVTRDSTNHFEKKRTLLISSGCNLDILQGSLSYKVNFYFSGHKCSFQ